MFCSFFKCVLTFALAINIEHDKGIMVRSMDGSFVPMSFVARAPPEGPLTVRMINNHDLAYLVSFHYSICALSTDEVIGNCPDGLVFVIVSSLGLAQS
jgi:hypothetical protein